MPLACWLTLTLRLRLSNPPRAPQHAKLARHIAVRGLCAFWRAPRPGAPRAPAAAAAAGPLPPPHPDDYLVCPMDTLLRITLVGPQQGQQHNPTLAPTASVTMVNGGASASAAAAAGGAHAYSSYAHALSAGAAAQAPDGSNSTGAGAGSRQGSTGSGRPLTPPPSHQASAAAAIAGVAAGAGAAPSAPSLTFATGGGTHVEVVAGCEAVAVQVRPEQLQSMIQLLDDMAVWVKRGRYGRFRPPGWCTAAQMARAREDAAAAGLSGHASSVAAAAGGLGGAGVAAGVAGAGAEAGVSGGGTAGTMPLLRSSSDPGRLAAMSRAALASVQETVPEEDEGSLAVGPSGLGAVGSATVPTGQGADGDAAMHAALAAELAALRTASPAPRAPPPRVSASSDALFSAGADEDAGAGSRQAAGLQAAAEARRGARSASAGGAPAGGSTTAAGPAPGGGPHPRAAADQPGLARAAAAAAQGAAAPAAAAGLNAPWWTPPRCVQATLSSPRARVLGTVRQHSLPSHSADADDGDTRPASASDEAVRAAAVALLAGGGARGPPAARASPFAGAAVQGAVAAAAGAGGHLAAIPLTPVAVGPLTWRHIWQYAGRAVLHDLRERRGTTSLRDHIAYKRAYCRLYRRKLEHLRAAEGGGGGGGSAATAAAAVAAAPPPLTASEVVELQRFEADLPLSDILTFRQLTEQELEAEADRERERAANRALVAAALGSAPPPAPATASASAASAPGGAPAAAQQRSWLAWGLSGVSGFFTYSTSGLTGAGGGGGGGRSSAVPQAVLSDAELAELYRLLQGTSLQAAVAAGAPHADVGSSHSAHGHGHGHQQHGASHHHQHASAHAASGRDSAAAHACASAAAPAASAGALPLLLQIRLLHVKLDIKGHTPPPLARLSQARSSSADGAPPAPLPHTSAPGSRVAAPTLLSVSLGSVSVAVESEGGSSGGGTVVAAAVGSLHAYDLASDPGVMECILAHSDVDLDAMTDAVAPAGAGAGGSAGVGASGSGSRAAAPAAGAAASTSGRAGAVGGGGSGAWGSSASWWYGTSRSGAAGGGGGSASASSAGRRRQPQHGGGSWPSLGALLSCATGAPLHAAGAGGGGGGMAGGMHGSVSTDSLDSDVGHWAMGGAASTGGGGAAGAVGGAGAGGVAGAEAWYSGPPVITVSQVPVRRELMPEAGGSSSCSASDDDDDEESWEASGSGAAASSPGHRRHHQHRHGHRHAVQEPGPRSTSRLEVHVRPLRMLHRPKCFAVRQGGCTPTAHGHMPHDRGHVTRLQPIVCIPRPWALAAVYVVNRSDVSAPLT